MGKLENLVYAGKLRSNDIRFDSFVRLLDTLLFSFLWFSTSYRARERERERQRKERDGEKEASAIHQGEGGGFSDKPGDI